MWILFWSINGLSIIVAWPNFFPWTLLIIRLVTFIFIKAKKTLSRDSISHGRAETI